ncbi:MAG: amidohydrolase [Pirellulaceae bacterium]|nr:MAG: amidohydrolase [Pirellulaceae bacterium]
MSRFCGLIQWLLTGAVRGLSGLVFLFSIAGSVLVQGQQPPADLVVLNGKIALVDKEFHIVEALAVRDGLVAATGSNAEIRRWIGPNTEQLDAQGKLVLPGLIDSHVHPIDAAVFEFDHPVPEMRSIADVLAYVRQRAGQLPAGEWIELNQVFITRLEEKRYPSRKELDEAAPHHPVIYRTGPDAMLNSLALKLSGIDRNTTLPPGSTGRIEKDPVTGEPTGLLRGVTYLAKVRSPLKRPGHEERLAAVRALLRDYNSVGITSIADRSTSDSELAIYQELLDKGQLTCRVFVYYALDPNQPLAQIEERLARAEAHPLHAYNPWVWLRGVKVFLDGGMLTGSAYMRQPWGVSSIYGIQDPSYRGELKIDPEKLYQIARLVMQHGFQMTAHAVGDGAVHTLLEAYDQVDKQFAVREHRPCVTHANFMSREAIDMMRRLGAVADLQPVWLWLDGATLRQQFGEQRMRYFQPYRSLFDAGVVVGGGSDHMQKLGSFRAVNPYNPFLGMWVTLTRQPRAGGPPLHPEEIITREEAIRLYTINNAFLSFEEQKKGSLEAGKYADFILLDRDILTCPVDEIPNTKVLATYLAGRKVFPPSGR